MKFQRKSISLILRAFFDFEVYFFYKYSSIKIISLSNQKRHIDRQNPNGFRQLPLVLFQFSVDRDIGNGDWKSLNEEALKIVEGKRSLVSIIETIRGKIMVINLEASIEKRKNVAKALSFLQFMYL